MNQLVRNRNMVDALASAVRGGSESLGQVPGLLCRVIEERAWQHFTTALGKDVEHERLADFITTAPLDGLGAGVDLVRKIIADDPRALDLFDRELQEPHGGDRRSASFKINNINLETSDAEAPERITEPAGTARRQALRKLRKEADRGNEQAAELHADVLADRLSAHAAMIEAGFRPKTITVPVARPEAVARSLLKYMSAEDIAKLIAVLLGKES